MYDFLKSLLQWRGREVTLIVVDPVNPQEPREHHLGKKSVNRWFTGLLLLIGSGITLIVGIVLWGWSPGGKARINADISMLQQRLEAVTDSVLVRDHQLEGLKRALLLGQISGIRATLPTEETEIVTGRPVPAAGQITRGFIPDLGHYGIDIAVENSTPVKSADSGVALSAEWSAANGYVVGIQHYDGHVLIYKHLINTPVKSGQLILEGETIGNVGRAGLLSSGPHLHVEVWRNGKPVDPMSYFITE